MKIAAFLSYLAAWLVFAIAALIGALPQLRNGPRAMTITAPVIIGTLLQLLAAFVITSSMGSEPLHPAMFELVGALVLSPFGAVLFTWALRSQPRDRSVDALVTHGAYRWLRHPLYLAFLAMLVASGLLVSAGFKLILAMVLYFVGSEFRIASEERELAIKFPDDYREYARRTRWRYLPGLR